MQKSQVEDPAGSVLWFFVGFVVVVSVAAILAEVECLLIWLRVWTLLSNLAMKSVNVNWGLFWSTRSFSSSWKVSFMYSRRL